MIDAGVILEVTRKLIGETEPYGSSSIDQKRAENLDKLIFVIDELLFDVEKVAYNKDRPEESMRMMGKKAHEALIGWGRWLEDYMKGEQDERAIYSRYNSGDV